MSLENICTEKKFSISVKTLSVTLWKQFWSTAVFCLKILILLKEALDFPKWHLVFLWHLNLNHRSLFSERRICFKVYFSGDITNSSKQRSVNIIVIQNNSSFCTAEESNGFCYKIFICKKLERFQHRIILSDKIVLSIQLGKSSMANVRWSKCPVPKWVNRFLSDWASCLSTRKYVHSKTRLKEMKMKKKIWVRILI